MKSLLLVFVLLSGVPALALKEIQLGSIGQGKLLHIKGLIQLPSGQKLNEKAPSQLEVYEKISNQWQRTEVVDLNEFFSMTELINFRKPVKLTSDKAEIKVRASVYHCPRVGRGICVIDDFEGVIQRSSKKVSSEVQVALVGSPPV